MARPLNNLLKKYADWHWDNAHANAFWAVKDRVLHANILALSNTEYSFSVVCDASYIAMAAPCCKHMLKVVSVLLHLNLFISKMLRVTCHEVCSRTSAPSQSSSIWIMHRYTRRHSCPTSIREYILGFPSLQNLNSRRNISQAHIMC